MQNTTIAIIVAAALAAAALSGCTPQPAATVQAQPPTAPSASSLDDAALARELAENDRIRRERSVPLPAPRPAATPTIPKIRPIQHKAAPMVHRERSTEDAGALSDAEWARASSANAEAAGTAPQIHFRSGDAVSSVEPEFRESGPVPAGLRVYGQNSFTQSRSHSGSGKRKSGKSRGSSRSGRSSHFSPKYGR